MTATDSSQNGVGLQADNKNTEISAGYRSTNHSYESVRGGQRFINWNAQPSSFKKYPKFYRRIGFDTLPSPLSFLSLIGSVNFEKKYGQDTYKLRCNPSAGALYPNEIYIQSRGMEGLEDGIYHYEVASSSLVFLAPISAGFGLEYFFDDKKEVRGLLFLVSAAYFRSSWKYENRSIRYCFLDAGHIMGAIEAAAQIGGFDTLFKTDIDHKALNLFFGFENKEYAVTAAIVGSEGERVIAKPPFLLPFVSPYDYFEQNMFVEGFLEDVCESFVWSDAAYRYGDAVISKELILSRRSVRAFSKNQIGVEEFFDFLEPFVGDSTLLYPVVNRVEGVKSGLYAKSTLIKDGDFSKKAGYLCLEQALGADSAVTFFIVAKDRANIKKALLEAGLFAHRVYLIGEANGIGVSGIGAYYDAEVSEFLGVDDGMAVLYAVAVGR